MSLYDQYQKEQKKSTGGLYDEYVKSQAPAQPKVPFSTKVKDLAVRGNALSTDMLRSLLRAPARAVTNLVNVQEIAKGKPETEPFTGKFLGEVKPLGNRKGFSQEAIVDAIGGGAELASYLPAGRAVTSGWKGLIKPLIKEGGLGGFSGSAGYELQKNAKTGEDISGKNIVFGTGAGMILAPLIGVASRGVSKVTRGTKPIGEIGSNVKPDTSALPVLEAGASSPTVDQDLMTSIIRNGKNSPEVRAKVNEVAPRFEPKQVEAPGDTITPALSSRVEADAVEKGLISRFENLPEARTMNMKEQARQSTELVNTNYEQAKRVAMGRENPPGDLRDASVFEAVKQKAIQDQDVQTLKELATESTIPSKLTAYGQEIKAADNMVDSNDPVELMQSVIQSRKKGADVKLRKEKIKELVVVRTNVKKNLPTKEDWATFISSIEC